MNGFVDIIFIEMTDGFRVPFLTRSGAPTGVYYSITQCRSVGLRPTTRLLFGLEVFDSLPRRNFMNRISVHLSATTSRACFSPPPGLSSIRLAALNRVAQRAPRFVSTACIASALTAPPSGQHQPENARPGPQRATLFTPRSLHRGFEVPREHGVGNHCSRVGWHWGGINDKSVGYRAPFSAANHPPNPWQDRQDSAG